LEYFVCGWNMWIMHSGGQAFGNFTYVKYVEFVPCTAGRGFSRILLAGNIRSNLRWGV
jgi:hypothetical protein